MTKENIIRYGRNVRIEFDELLDKGMEESIKAWSLFRRYIDEFKTQEEKDFFSIGFFFGSEEEFEEFLKSNQAERNAKDDTSHKA